MVPACRGQNGREPRGAQQPGGVRVRLAGRQQAQVRQKRLAIPQADGVDPFERLSQDVHQLGTWLGQVLREQDGRGLFNAVERLRTQSIRERGRFSVPRRRRGMYHGYL